MWLFQSWFMFLTEVQNLNLSYCFPCLDCAWLCAEQGIRVRGGSQKEERSIVPIAKVNSSKCLIVSVFSNQVDFSDSCEEPSVCASSTDWNQINQSMSSSLLRCLLFLSFIQGKDKFLQCSRTELQKSHFSVGQNGGIQTQMGTNLENCLEILPGHLLSAAGQWSALKAEPCLHSCHQHQGTTAQGLTPHSSWTLQEENTLMWKPALWGTHELLQWVCALCLPWEAVVSYAINSRKAGLCPKQRKREFPKNHLIFSISHALCVLVLMLTRLYEAVWMKENHTALHYPSEHGTLAVCINHFGASSYPQ